MISPLQQFVPEVIMDPVNNSLWIKSRFYDAMYLTLEEARQLGWKLITAIEGREGQEARRVKNPKTENGRRKAAGLWGPVPDDDLIPLGKAGKVFKNIKPKKKPVKRGRPANGGHLKDCIQQLEHTGDCTLPPSRRCKHR